METVAGRCASVLASFGHFFWLRAAGGISVGRALRRGWEPASGRAPEPLALGVVSGSAYSVVPLGPQSRARHSLLKQTATEVICCWPANVSLKTKMPIDTEPEICQRGQGALLVSKPCRLSRGQQRLLACSSSPASDISTSKCEEPPSRGALPSGESLERLGCKSEGDGRVPAVQPKGRVPRAATRAPGPPICPVKQSKN